MSEERMSEQRFDLHAIRYGEVFSADLENAGYTEELCSACPHDHRCCDMMVFCTPAEVAGILQWLSKNAPDVMAVSSAVQFRAGVLGDHFKKFGGDIAAGVSAWADKKLKCVFYDKEKKGCSIYPVRPITCRRVYGVGDCSDMYAKPPGWKAVSETAEVLTERVSRFKIHPDPQNNIAELTSLVNHMASNTNGMYVDDVFFDKNPAELTDDQIMFGLAGPPVPNPVALEAKDGRT